MATALSNPTLMHRLFRWVQGFDVPLAIAAVGLAGLGLLVMYSSGHDHGTRFVDHARNMLIALAVLLVVMHIPPQRWMELAVPVYVVGVCLLVAVALFGVARKGAQRWLDVGITIQPSEVLKIAVPLVLAWWFQKREGQLRAADFLVAFAMLSIPVGLIMHQPDLGTALLVLTAGMAVMYFAGLSWTLVLPPLILGGVGILLLIVWEPELCAQGVRWPVLYDYQQQRVCTLLDPWKDPLGKGFHIIQGMIAIGSGGVWGKGFMKGTQTHLEFIPERTTDFVFAAYAEEFGLLGVLVLVALYVSLVLRALAIAVDAPTMFARLLGGAIAVIIFCYAFVNLGMVSGILPVVGIPLPFLSYGGTAMVTLGVCLGILMSIARSRRLMPG
ncbi:rod shape-determining protein RodA [Candidatus Symbiobacter mobilis]|uniref:Peptidoglycan glycosyltransferase MrdB n=1 Tax=Candidatus Symbiobacter mobilis CR TaxID=946483 RepID=U5N634_9BURK|nr:rod shape-determining protein RodA [Candidatus Symbiobacter mobilis CR]